jgi:hypothetical protein
VAITWSQLLDRIASRINRDDLAAAIREIAEERVHYYASEVFYSANVYDRSITTVKGTKFYDLPSGWQDCNSIRVLQGTPTTGIWLTLTGKDYEYLNNLDNLEPPVQSVPAYWALYNNPATGNRAFRLFPTPGTTYNVELTLDKPPDVPQDNATNFWCDDAMNLILYATAAEIFRVHISNPVRAQEFADAEARERLSMGAKTIRARGGIQIRPYL